MLYYSIHLPTNRIPQAGHKICHGHLVDLARKRKVHLVSQVNEREKAYLDSDFNFCTTSNFIPITNTDRILNIASNITLPLRIAVRADKKTQRIIRSLTATHDISEIFIEYEQGASVIPFLDKHITKTVVFHDVISQYVKRKFDAERANPIRKLLIFIEWKITTRWERKILNLIDYAIVFSDKDKNLLVELGADPSKIIIEHPRIDEQYFYINRTQSEPQTMLFWGALNRTENEDAVLWFLNSIYPKIRSRIPSAKLIIMGANPSAKIMDYSSPSIMIPGYVENPIPFFEKAAIGIAPLRLGAGLKIKVLEFMAARIHTVCTSVAAEGIAYTKDQITIAENETDFANAVVSRLQRQHDAP